MINQLEKGISISFWVQDVKVRVTYQVQQYVVSSGVDGKSFIVQALGFRVVALKLSHTALEQQH